METPQNYDVIISGAGPVGLFLACELALAKCTVLILEKAETPYSPLKKLPFGMRGISAPTVEALYRRGLLDELEIHKRIKEPHQKAQEPVVRRQVGHFAGIPFYSSDIDYSQWPYRLPGSTATQLMTEMEELETVLARRAITLGVTIKRGFEVTNLNQSAEEIIVIAKEQTFTGKWLVGCDGSRSIVRKLGGFDFVGTEPEFTGYTAQVDLADPEKLKLGRNVTATGMYLLSQKDYLILQDFDYGSFHNSRKPITLDHLQGVLRRISGTDVTINALYTSTTWTDRSRQSSTYRNGRILLAGDAAHIHSPLGGQGLNLGLGDAMNLGWKLAATIKNSASESLLDSYQTERHPVGEKVLDWSRAQVAVMKPEPAARALNAIIQDLMKTRDGATYFAGRVWGLLTRYNLGDDHPLVGSGIPNFEFEDGKLVGQLMQDGKAMLLDFEMNDSLKNIMSKYEDHISYISGKVKNQLGVSVMLVRPDGIVAWVADNNPDVMELQKAISRWFAI
ncbi:FAD-dependent oxidoreductase [Chitinophaga silvatica]|uniref:FAD-dependent oxidoreductase n=2 Tax=Chitinophaga silvatica TaxID=2282649 RepID=A0A3E1Y693_9BACT|nr:FAD-dependent oxidoreductase [Chitinophaga silvatica]